MRHRFAPSSWTMIVSWSSQWTPKSSVLVQEAYRFACTRVRRSRSIASARGGWSSSTLSRAREAPLEELTQCLDSPVGEHTAGELQERLVDVVADLPADP